MEYAKNNPSGGMRLTPEEILKRQVAAQAKKDEFQQLYQDAYVSCTRLGRTGGTEDESCGDNAASKIRRQETSE